MKQFLPNPRMVGIFRELVKSDVAKAELRVKMREKLEKRREKARNENPTEGKNSFGKGKKNFLIVDIFIPFCREIHA